MKLIMLGAPGAGKGTQADMLSKAYKIPHISTGDIFRENIRNNTELGKLAVQYTKKGLLVPDEVVVDLVIDRIKKDDCNEGFILDGFPRTIPQAESLTQALEAVGMMMDFAVDVEVPDEVIISRLSGRRSCPNCSAIYHVDFKPSKVDGICDKDGGELIQRADDKPETVLKRLEVYHEQTQPLIDYYTNRGNLFTVDGTKSTEEVFLTIQQKLGE